MSLSRIVKLPRTAYLLVLLVALLIAVGSWVSRSRVPLGEEVEINTGELTENERSELKGRGMIILPGVESVLLLKEAKGREKIWRLTYRLDDEELSAQLFDALRTPLVDMGWRTSQLYETSHGQTTSWWCDKGPTDVTYAVGYREGPGTYAEGGLWVDIDSRRTTRPTQTPKRRPIS